MKILLNNDQEIVINNEDGKGPCIASLVDSSDGEIISAVKIDEGLLLDFIQSQWEVSQDSNALKIAELRSLKEGDAIIVGDNTLGFF